MIGGDEWGVASPWVVVAVVLLMATATTGTAAAQQDLGVTLETPTEATVGDQTTLSASVSTPDLPGSPEGELTVTFYSDGEEIGSKTVTVGDGETTAVEITHTFESAGETEVTVEVSAEIARQEFSDSAATTIDVTEPATTTTPDTPTRPQTTTVEGVAFAVPESLEDEVEEYRDDAPDDLQARAFVLATEEELYVVFTRQEPRTGVATVEGVVRDRDVETENLTFGVIGASSASFDTTGTETTVREVSRNPEQYRLELVRIGAQYRRVATLTDPDSGEDITVAATSGILVSNPRTASSLFQAVGEKARRLSKDASAERIDATLEDPRGPHLHTVSFETAFWADAPATVDAVVLTPGSAARAFAAEYGPAGVVHAEDGQPVLYVAEESFDSRSVADVAAITSRAASLDGQVVETEVRLYQERISVQETLEHNTGCNQDLLQVQTPQGPVCVNVVQDVLLHGGLAWNDIPQSRDGGLVVLGVSSNHQDAPEQFEEGRYRIEGEVVSSSRIDASLPEGAVLVVYELERVGSIDYDAVRAEARGIIETRAGELTTRLRGQVGGGDVEIATNRAVEGTGPATPGEPATVRFPERSRGPVAIEQARITVSTPVETLRVETAEVTSIRGDVPQPPGRQIRVLNVSASVSEEAIAEASFRVRVSTAAIPDGETVTVHRFHDGAWTRLETSVVSRDETAIVVEVRTPGFSYFAVSTGGAGAVGTSANDQATATEEGTGDAAASATSTSGQPGFTALAVLVAVTAFVGWRLRR
jgi:PGF-pre-PGF domain-containing protein